MADRIDSYERLHLLGKGGMGEVWRARYLPNGMIRALKIVKSDAVKEPELRERFQRECEIAGGIDHPHIVTVHDFATGADGGTPFIAMTLIDGDNLARILDDGPLVPERAVAIITQMASALDTAHGKGLRHRDVKPHNIMVERLGPDRDHASLIDWGIAQPIVATEAGPVTRTGVFVGTPHYIAPERLGNRETPDLRADIYSLAVVLYECLAGRLPFEGDQNSVLRAHLRNSPPPLPRHVPAPLHAVVRKGMAKKPDDRYQSAEEFGHALSAAMRQWHDRQARNRLLAVLVPGLVGLAVALLLGVTQVVGAAALLWITPALFAAGLLVGYGLHNGGERVRALPETRESTLPGELPGRAA